MSESRLERPSAAEDLYLATCVDEVEPCRPLLTGDVFVGVQIPGLDSAGMAIVLTHPCSMRQDGVHLADRLLLAEVSQYQDVPLAMWAKGHFKVMPLPGLLDGPDLAAHFEKIGLVSSEVLQQTDRVASLTPLGINLLQQRLIWYLTRFVAPTHLLNDACSAVFEEADLCEEWALAVTASGEPILEAFETFHIWIRSLDNGGRTWQESLSDPQRRAVVRRAMRDALANRG